MDEDELWKIRGFIDRSPNRKTILYALDEHGDPMKPKEIADQEDLRLATVSRRLSDLKERGLVSVVNPDQNRDRYYRLTDKGREYLDNFRDK